MKEPHVESLVYRAESGESIIYDDPPPIEIDMDKWEGCLENGILTCRMKTHYASISDARTATEGYLRAWEVNANLKHGKDSIKFVYQDANVVDLTPQKTGRGLVICGKAVAMGIGTMTASVQIISKNYPPPPEMFIVSPDVEALWTRYEGYLDGRERLLPMAHWCLTKIEASYGQGNREAAANTIKVSSKVLSTLGRLTCTRGDDTEARKIPKRGELQPLSRAERTWIEAVIKVLIRRVGEYAGCDDSSILDKINMQDFPPLG